MFERIDKGGEKSIMDGVWRKHGVVAEESLGKSPLADCTLRKLQIWCIDRSGYLPMENMPCNAAATGKTHSHTKMNGFGNDIYGS